MCIYRSSIAIEAQEATAAKHQHKRLGDRPLGASTLASGKRYACVGQSLQAVADRDIQQKVLHYISGRTLRSRELQSAEEKIDATVITPRIRYQTNIAHTYFTSKQTRLLREGIRVGEGSRSTHNTNLSITRRRLYNFTEVGALRETFGEGSNQP